MADVTVASFHAMEPIYEGIARRSSSRLPAASPWSSARSRTSSGSTRCCRVRLRRPYTG
jgi:hypothetical protein